MKTIFALAALGLLMTAACSGSEATEESSASDGTGLGVARSAATAQRTCYVGPDTLGPTRGDGSYDMPYGTVNEALAKSCTTIYLRAGVHTEAVKIKGWRGTATQRLFIGPASGERVTLRGRQITTDLDLPGQFVISILDSSYVTISGFTIEHDATSYCPWVPPYIVGGQPYSMSFCNSGGITIASLSANGNEGIGEATHHVAITGNVFQNIRNSTAQMIDGTRDRNGVRETLICACVNDVRVRPCGDTGGWAFGACHAHSFALPLTLRSGRINTTGDLDEAVHHVDIIGNTFRDSNTSSFDENVAVITMGLNVADVLVERNDISNVKPRAGTSAADMTGVQLSGSTSSPSPLFRPRRITIRRNRFADLSGSGIYAVQPTDVLIERNKIDRTPRGVQVASEPADPNMPPGAAIARNTWIRDNLIRDSSLFAIDLGMQLTSYRPIQNTYVTNNTIVANWGSSAYDRFPIVTRSGVQGDSLIANNIVRIHVTSPLALRAGDAMWLWESTELAPSTPLAQNNLWHFTIDTAFGSMRLTPVFVQPGYPGVRRSFGELGEGGVPAGGVAGVSRDPGFVQGSDPQRLLSTSPAIDAGRDVDPPSWAGPMFRDRIEADYFGFSRKYGPRRDIGMEERQPGLLVCGNAPGEAPYCR